MPVTVEHKDITAPDIHPATFVQTSDPGAVGDDKLWIDKTTGTNFATGWLLKIRATSNTVWTTILDLLTLLAPAMTTLTDGATITWTVTGKRKDVAQLTIAGARTLAISGASSGFVGVIHITESGASRSLALPGSSIVANTGAGAIALSGVSGGKQKWTVSYDGTNYWWEHGDTYT